MQRFISFLLSFTLLFSNIAFDYKNVQAEDVATQAAAQSVQTPSTTAMGFQPAVATDPNAKITFSDDGNLTKPVVTATINTGGKKIVGITYDRGYNQIAKGTSKRIYGYEGQSGTVSVNINDVFKYVSVYVVLADENNVKTEVVNNYTLTSKRLYNQSNDTFAPYPVTPLNDNTNKSSLIMDKVGTASATDNGPMIVVDDEVWVFGDGADFDVYRMDDIDGYFGTKNDIAKKSYTIAGTNFIEYGTSIIYDGRYVIGINESGYLIVFDAVNPATQYNGSAAKAIFKGYDTFTGSAAGGLYGANGVQNLIFDGTNIFLASYSGHLYKATANGDGTYTIGTTSLGKFKPNAGGTVYDIDVVYDGDNIWATDATNDASTFVYKTPFNTATGTMGTTVSINLGGTNYPTSLVYDGGNYIYTLITKAQVTFAGGKGLMRINKSDNTFSLVYQDSIATPASHEDISFDGRNIWIQAYSVANTNLQRYDTVDNKRETLLPAQVMDGPAGDQYMHNINGVYDGKYQWEYRYSDKHINIVGRKLDLKFGATGSYGALNKDLTKSFLDATVAADGTVTFADSKSQDAATMVYVDDKETTKPDYVAAKTTGANSTSNIVFGAWTYDKTAADAATRNDAFFKDLTKAIDTEAMDKNEYTSFRNHVGEYFTIPKGELPTVPSSGGSFNYSLPTYPKLDGFYTLYFVNAEGRPYYETVEVKGNYKELTRLYINFEDKDTGEIVKQTMDDTFAMGSSATIKYATFASELAADGYELADTISKTKTMDATSKEMTFLVSKDKTKWTEIIYKPYYISNADPNTRIYFKGEIPSKKYYLVNDANPDNLPTVDADKKPIARFNRSANIDATHFDGMKLKDPKTSPQTVLLPSTNGGTKIAYGRTVVEFEYTPEKSVVLVKGIGVDAAGNATGDAVYSTYESGNLYDDVTVTAQTVDTWTLKGLATVDATGKVTSVLNGTNTYKAKFGTDEIVYFAYTQNTMNFDVQYIDKATGTVLGTDRFPVEENDTITLVAKDFAGYSLSKTDMGGAAQVSSKTLTATPTTAGVTYKFYYDATGMVVNVKGVEVDASGNLVKTSGIENVIYTEQVKGQEGKTATVNANSSLTNWTLYGLVNYNADGTVKDVTKDASSKAVVMGTDTQVAFAYTRKMATVTVEYVDEAGARITGVAPDTFTIPLNTEFTAVAKAIDGYKLTNPLTAKQDPQVITQATSTITFKYAKITETVTVKAVDGTGKLLGLDSVDLKLGDTNVAVDLNTLSLGTYLAPRYSLATTDTRVKTIPTVAESTVVTYVFTENVETVTVNYKDNTGAMLPASALPSGVTNPMTYTYPYGTQFQIDAISINKYYIPNGNTLTTGKVTAGQANRTVDFKYTKVAGDILVMAKDETTGAILEYKVISGNQDVTGTFNVTNGWTDGGVSGFTGSWIPKYALKDPAKATQSFTFSDKLQTLVFSYNKNTFTVTVNAKDGSGNDLQFLDGNNTKIFTYYQGDSYNIYAPPVKGYEVNSSTKSDYNISGTISANVSKTFVYTKINTDVVLAVKLISEDGTAIVGAKTVVGDRGVEGSVGVDNATGKVILKDKDGVVVNANVVSYDTTMWELATTETASKTFTYGSDHSVEFKLKRKTATLTVKYWSGTSGSAVAIAGVSDDVSQVGVGTTQKVVAKMIDLYELQTGQASYVNEIIDPAGNTVNIYYKPVSGNTLVYVRVPSEDGVILEKRILQYNTSDVINVDQTFIDSLNFNTFNDTNYTYTGPSTTSLTVNTDPSKNIIYLDFKPKTYNVTVDYKSGSATVADSKILQVKSGTHVVEYAANVPFYNLASGQAESHDFGVVTSDATYTFQYEEILIPDGVINLIAIDPNGKILDMTSLRGTVGTSIKVDSKYYFPDLLNSYTIDEASSANLAEPTFKNGFVNVYFTYKPIEYEVTVTAVKKVDGVTPITFDNPGQYKYTVLKGDDITVYAPAIDGWILVGTDFVTLSKVDKSHEVKFEYMPIDKVIVAKGIEVDPNNNNTPVNTNGIENIIYSKTIGGNDNENRPIEASNLNGNNMTGLANWTFVGLVNYKADGTFDSVTPNVYEKTVTFGTDSEVVFAYTRKTATVTVEYVDVTANPTNVIATDTFKVPYNTEFIATARALQGYELNDFSAGSYMNKGTVTGDKTISFAYKKLSETVKIEARLGSKSGTLLAQYSEDIALGSTNVTVTADKISALISPRYALDTTIAGNTNSQLISVVTTDTTVTYVYKEQISTITVSYTNNATSISAVKVYQVPYGNKVVESATSVKDYYLDTAKSQPTQTIDVVNQPAYNLNFEYARSNGEISVIAKDQATGEILYYKSYTGTQGNTLSVTDTTEFAGKKFLNYYTRDNLSPATQSLTFTNTHQEIIYNYNKVTYTVTLKAVDTADHSKVLNFYTGKNSMTYTYTKGDTYEIYAPPVPDYYADLDIKSSYSNTTGITGDITHTFYYKKIELGTNITVKAVSVDGDIVGNVIIGSETISGKRETVATVTPDQFSFYDPTNWELVGTAFYDVTFGIDKEVVFTFKRKTADVKVLYSSEGSSIATTLTETVPANSYYTGVALVIENYVLAPGEKQSFTTKVGAAGTTTTIEFKYIYAPGNVAIEAIDVDSNKLLMREYDQWDAGIKYETPIETKNKILGALVGYEYVPTSVDFIETVDDVDITKNIVTLKYRKVNNTITVNYVDEAGNPIAASSFNDVQYGRSFETYAPNFENYNLVDGEQSYYSIDKVTGSQVITFKYYLNNGCVINAVAKTAEGKVLALKSYVGVLGQDQRIVAEEAFGTIVGYTLAPTESLAKTGRYINGLTTVEFLYVPVGLTITIKAVDDGTGLPLVFTEPSVLQVQEGSTTQVYAPHITAYEVIAPSYVEVKEIKDSTTVTFRYKKIAVPARIIVKHVAKVGNTEILIKAQSYDGNIGQSFTASPLSAADQTTLGYRVLSDSNFNKTVTFAAGSNADIVFNYERVMVTLNRNYVVDIYKNQYAYDTGKKERTMDEAEKAADATHGAAELVNTTTAHEINSWQTIVAPFASGYVFDTTNYPNQKLRRSIQLSGQDTTETLYYKNITGNVLLRAVVKDEAGSLEINGQRYTLIAQIEDNCAVGAEYINAGRRRLDLDSIVAPGYGYSNSGTITNNGVEIFTPATDAAASTVLTYVYTADVKTVTVYYKDAEGKAIDPSKLGLTKNPYVKQVINGEYITHYAINADSYNFVGSKVSSDNTVTAAKASSTSNDILTSLSYYNIAVDADTIMEFFYDTIVKAKTVTLNYGGSSKTETINLVTGQTLFAPYVPNFYPTGVNKYVIGDTIQDNYTFTYAPIQPVVISGSTQYVYRDYPKQEVDHSATEFGHESYVSGYPDGTFGADKNVTRAEVVALFYNILHEDSDTTNYKGTKFPDVKADAWYAEAVNFMSAKKYITGYEDGTFRPNQNITREEFAGIISGAFGTSNVQEFMSLPLDPTRWSTKHIINTYTSGYYDGIDLINYNFRAKINRAEVIVMLNNATHRVPNKEYLGTVKAPSDLSKNHWAYYEILEAITDHTGYYEGNFGDEHEVIYTDTNKK